MATKTQISSMGTAIIKVDWTRTVVDADSYGIARRLCNTITYSLILVATGKTLVSGSFFEAPPKGNYPAGAMRLGDGVVQREVVAIFEDLKAQLDIENPKSDEYIEIENRINEAIARNEADAHRIEAEADLMRRMDDPNSIL